jgi:hypothetical protein
VQKLHRAFRTVLCTNPYYGIIENRQKHDEPSHLSAVSHVIMNMTYKKSTGFLLADQKNRRCSVDDDA